MPARDRRRSTRLPGQDYRELGAYFVTICTHGRQHLFGRVVAEDVLLIPIGEVAQAEWIRTGEIREEVRLDESVIMPNHVDTIVIIEAAGHQNPPVGPHCNAPLRRPPRSLGSMIGLYRGAVTRRARRMAGNPNLRIWQRGYYDRVVRNRAELNRLRHCIRQNPLRWSEDEYCDTP